MKGLGYFEKLSLAAHWFLPREEAEDTIRDYRELLEDMGEKAFKRKFGGPVRAAVFSADKRKIWMWQGACGFLLLFGVFLALGFCFGINPFFEFPLFDWQALFIFLIIFCLVFWLGTGWALGRSFSKRESILFFSLLTVFSVIGGFAVFELLVYCFPMIYFDSYYPEYTISFAAVFALLWFGFQKREKQRLPRLLLAGLIAVMLFFLTFTALSFRFLCVDMQPHFGFGPRIVSLMRILILLLCMSLIAALVMARVSDVYPQYSLYCCFDYYDESHHLYGPGAGPC